MLYRQGTLTSRQLTEHYISRIETLNPLLNAVVEVNPDALSEADRRRFIDELVVLVQGGAGEALDVGHLVEGGESGFAVESRGGEEDFAYGHRHGGDSFRGGLLGLL